MFEQKRKPDCPYTLHKWLDDWYKAYKVPYLAENSLGTIEVAIRVHLKKGLPDLPLNRIEGMEIQKFFNTMTYSRSRKTVYDVLNGALKEACNLKYITENPMQGVKIPVHHRKQGEALTKDEQREFLEVIKGHEAEDYFKFLLFTGCRRNEGLSLRWSDIDLQKKQIHIRGTKTEKSNRTIPLFDNVATIFAKTMRRFDGIIFDFRPDRMTHTFKKFCPTHKLHDLRHTFATNCLEAKISMKVVQKWLGHSEIDTTANIYSHVTEDIGNAEAELFNQYQSKKARSQ